MNYIAFINKYLGKDIGNNYIQISNGRDYEVVIYDNMVFRFPKNKEKGFELNIEKQKLDIVSKYVYVKVPECTVIKSTCIMYPIIPGITFDSLNVSYTDDLIHDIISFLKQLHNIPLEEFGFLDTNKDRQVKSDKGLLIFVENLKNKIYFKLKDKVPVSVITSIDKYMNELFFEYESPQKAFVHTDIQPKNIIYDENKKKLSGIIDFTDSRIGGIELDFCYFYDQGEEILRKAIKYYRGFDDSEFFDRVFFLAKRGVLFEIDNDAVFENNQEYILNQLKKYKFL